MLHSAKKPDEALFVPVEACGEYCRRILDIDTTTDDVRVLIEAHILPVFAHSGSLYVLVSDLISVASILSTTLSLGEAVKLGPLWGGSSGKYGLWLSSHTRIASVSDRKRVYPTFFAAVRNLTSLASTPYLEGNFEAVSVPYFPPSVVVTSSPRDEAYAKAQVRRDGEIRSSRASQFANSAYYMGSKRDLAGFIVEAVSNVLPESGLVVDLMCGSGATASAFAREWPTMASDLQQFCRVLASIQGSGFTESEAHRLLTDILPRAYGHAEELSRLLSPFLEREEAIFHGDIDPDLLNEYRDFLAELPTYPDAVSKRGSAWDPVVEVEQRKHSTLKVPYCLFTAYFANVYFGLRQCIEIDSLRFAIDQVHDESDRRWALGALLAAVSALGTTYGGHFAQPRIKKQADLTLDNLSWVLKQRSYSITHEFNIRLLNLAEESEHSPRPIMDIPGPWRQALHTLDGMDLAKGEVVVYIDAPYKRDEYSRYYHVLETLVTYTYPSSTGSGKTPSKKTKERSASEFSTRSMKQLTDSFISIIVEVVKRDWICAWSYANTGAVSIPRVLEGVVEATGCQVRSFSTPYVHKAQGGRKEKEVTEYLMLLIPEQTRR